MKNHNDLETLQIFIYLSLLKIRLLLYIAKLFTKNMKKILLVFFLVVISLSSNAFAESIYDIKMPSGSADINAPFHWSSEKDGDTSGHIEIIINDVIQWKNADTVAHTVTSGTPQNGPTGIFDSGEIKPGGIFVKQFTEIGKFPYYCTIHPWREGIVNVVSGNSILPKVGSDVGDGSKTFDLEYKFNRILNQATIDDASKSITLELKGKTMNDENTLMIILPSPLISGISSITIDGIQSKNFTQNFEDNNTILVIDEIPPYAKSITIQGTTIIPEFKEFALLTLVLSFVAIILISKKVKSKTLTEPKIKNF